MENLKALLESQKAEITKSLETINKQSFDLKLQKDKLTKILKQVEKSISELQ